MRLDLRVNGVTHRLDVDDDELLLDVLRRRLDCTSVREGCGVGACGACTVLLDGRSASSCLVLAARCASAAVLTAEGLGDRHPVIEAFVNTGALQCGYCIPGFVMMVVELLAENPDPDEHAVRDHLEGNLCRCGTYPEILRAVRVAAEAGLAHLPDSSGKP